MTGIDLAGELVKLDNTIMIGSQRLEVATEESDVDLCVYGKELTKSISKYLPIVKNSYYHDSLLTVHSIYTKCEDIDVFIFDDLSKLRVVNLVMEIMEDLPKFVVKIKWVRVKIFRHLLNKHGFLDH